MYDLIVLCVVLCGLRKELSMEAPNIVKEHLEQQSLFVMKITVTLLGKFFEIQIASKS